MRRFKKLGLCVSLVTVATLTLALPVSASSNDVDNSYTQTINYRRVEYTDVQKLELYAMSRVLKPSSKYQDAGIIAAAEDKISKGCYVFDLKEVTDYGIYEFKSSEDKVFSYGIVVENPADESHTTCICKCSKTDYDELTAYINNVNSNSEYSYDPESEILTIDVTWN
ncbi:MAG: hypothetical protein IKS48_11875 [Eubacterium sp.]|nr:hypothetical protein [Eubacterium sp.]